MDINEIQVWIDQNPEWAFVGVIVLSIILFVIARWIIARGLIYLANRSKTKYDDIIVHSLRPFRVAWLVPILLVYSFAYLLPEYQIIIEKIALFFVLWVVIVTVNALLGGVNQVYEASPSFTGVSIQGYLDIIGILIILVGLILSVSIFTDESPLALLTGLGAITAVLLLIFRDTILSLVASIQISTLNLIREGDWLEVPSYGADGDVINMTLHTIKVQNWDKTISVIPTYKITEVAYKNWRGMQESGGRRIKRALSLDMSSIKFCDHEMLRELRKIDLIHDYLEMKVHEVEEFRQKHADRIDSPLDGPQITNVEVFREYISSYLKSREDIHQEGMSFLVRALAPSPMGLPIEVYVFTKTTAWDEYEAIQAEIFDHLLAAASSFDLHVFQEPTGMDFATFASGRAKTSSVIEL
jgi:miniconductance mechanosensitive channel